MTNWNIAYLSSLVHFRQEMYYDKDMCIINQREQDFTDKWAWGWLYDQS